MSILPQYLRLWPVILAMAAMLLLTLLPQIRLWLVRGEDWRVPYVDYRGDQLVYAAYVNALVDGRPRRNDPYTGRDDQPGAPAPETFLSIQFVPAYTLSLTAHTLHMSTSDVFVLLRCVVGLASILVLFWLIWAVTSDDSLAAVGALSVLCLGTVVTSYGPVRFLLPTPSAQISLPFLRLYEPAFGFPFFFVFCIIVWYILTRARRRIAYLLVIIAGLTFALLLFSYFYLWTAAAAWIGCLFLLWLMAKPEGWSRSLRLLSGVGILAALSLVPYIQLLKGLAPSVESEQLLILTHRPTIFWLPQLIGTALSTFLVYGVYRGFFFYKDPTVLFTASFAIVPIVLFNQQVITGRSLQPNHYQLFVSNYCVLLAIILTIAIIWRRRTGSVQKKFPMSALLCCALSCFGWGAWETMVRSRRFESEFKKMNDARSVAIRLSELGRNFRGTRVDTYSVVLASDHTVAEYLSTLAPQPSLWTLHMFVLSRCPLAEERERFFKYLYYTGRNLKSVDGARFEELSKVMAIRGASVGTNEYVSYATSFDRNGAATPLLSYIVTSPEENINFSNLDRWYERDAGEQIGKYILYRVKLR